MSEAEVKADALIADEDDADEAVKGAIKVEEKISVIKQKQMDRDRKFKVQIDEVKKDKIRKFWSNVSYHSAIIVTWPFRPSSYVKVIQCFEDLLYTIFVDSLMVFILGALAYIIYTVMVVKDTANVWMTLVKIIGCVFVCCICSFAQMHVTNLSKREHKDSDSESERE